MRSFHHSRARVFFEVLCAFGIAASCVAAWTQTGATAMLAAAAIAGLYGLVHAFDMVRPRAAVAVPVASSDIVGEQKAEDPVAAEVLETPDVAHDPVVETQPTEPVAAPASKSRAKAPRKSGARRAKAPKEAQAPEVAAEAVVPFEQPAEIQAEPQDGEAAASEPEDGHHAPVVPLFEADPFVRQQRTVFGRKAG